MNIPIQFILFTIIGFAIGWLLATGDSKTQWVRLIDVIIYGPFLLWIASSPFLQPIQIKWVQICITLLGSSTISYNLYNLVHHIHHSKK